MADHVQASCMGVNRLNMHDTTSDPAILVLIIQLLSAVGFSLLIHYPHARLNDSQWVAV